MWFIFLLCVAATSANFVNQLSFSGGGSFGAVEIGILKKITEQWDITYDIYTGISAGALNAGFLSYFEDVKSGITYAEQIYGRIDNRAVYKLSPLTGVSVLNTDPLCKTLSVIVVEMDKQSVVHTLIGATNLNSGNLDVFSFEDNTDENKVRLLMSSSAIPGLFPPIEYGGYLYADGGVLSNSLLNVEHTGDYTNITFITPYEGFVYQSEPIENLKDMLERTIRIVSANFNNPLSILYQNCKYPIGEINAYFVNSAYLKGFNMLNFNDGAELIEIGYNHAEHRRYNLC